jgi:hypothetical protein
MIVVVNTARHRKCALEPKIRARKHEKQQCSQGKTSHKVDKDLARSNGLCKGVFCVFTTGTRYKNKTEDVLFRSPNRNTTKNCSEYLTGLERKLTNRAKERPTTNLGVRGGESMLQELNSYKSPPRRRVQGTFIFLLYFACFIKILNKNLGCNSHL